MQRVRRFASTAVVAALAVSGLAACRSEPGVAAYLGDRQITVERVNEVYEDARTKLDGALQKAREFRAERPEQDIAPLPDAVPMPITREDVLVTLLGQDLIKRYAQAKGVQPTKIDTAALTKEIPLTGDAEFIIALAEYRGYVESLAIAAQPQQITEADLTDVFNRLRDGGGLGAGAERMTVRDWARTLTPQQQEVLAKFVALREDLKKAAAEYRATVNPRFGSGELPLLPFSAQDRRLAALVVLPLDTSNRPPAVADVS